MILSLLVISGFSIGLYGQTKINGIINKYGKVTSLGIDYVIVNDATQFAQFSVGDTVLLIQMKGVRINSNDDFSYGTPENSYGKPGKHEFLLISAVDGGLKKLTFTSLIINTFDVSGFLQIIKVPSFNSALVDVSDLTCAPWDSTSRTGGVLAVIIGRSLSLNKNIDVTGKGFIGGAASIGAGICAGTDLIVYDKYVYNSVYNNSGFKGESSVTRGVITGPIYPPIYPDYSKGKGANFTGGGGANGKFSGGGGGGNYGAGGKGGLEINDCSPTYARADGGRPAIQLKFVATLDGGIFLGGGGGASTYLAGSTPSPGGKGGGIVIIISDEIKGNGKSIIANGATTVQAASNSGAGGGGGGGTVAIYLQSFSTSLITLSANGGKGGNNAGSFGEGGGGGGGLINLSNITIPANVTRTVASGGHGTRVGGFSAGDGATGESRTDFVAVLNGFLFNSIRSSVTGDQVDSICSNMMPQKITGTKPVGGQGPYTYLWEKSYNAAFTAPIALVNDVDPTNYTPTVIETATVWFRRTITDSSLPTNLVDVSKPVKIIVQPFIKNNIVGTSDTICFAQDPPAFVSKAVLQDGNGIYSFIWKVSTDNILFSLPVNTYNTEGYTPPPALTLTSWYKRIVTSGRCADSTANVKITVLPLITNNQITNAPPDICYGMTFTDITATTSPTLAGGDNTYRFKWESSTNGTTWVTATGISNLSGYNPDELSPSFPGNEYYRRVVKSGSNDVCVNTSTSVLLKDFPVITNNAITANQTICSGSAPAKITGSIPLNGNGIYTYLWQDSTKAQPVWTNISGATGSDYVPPALTDTTRYRRIVNSSACSDISKSIKINVHKPILNNNISLLAGALTDTTICNAAIPHKLKGTAATGGTNIPGDYAYQWLYSIDNTNWNPVASGGTQITYQPPSLTSTTYYKRKVISGSCTVISSSTITVTVLPSISNNVISANQTVCYNTAPAQLTGATLSGGTGTYTYLWEQSADGITWTAASGTNNISGYQPPVLTLPVKYKRTVKSGAFDCCISVSNVIDITIYPPLPTGRITNVADTNICGGSQVLLRIEMTGSAPWKVTYKENTVDAPFIPVSTNKTTFIVTPVSATALDLYTYSLSKVEDNNGCIATPVTLTGNKKANVYKIPVAKAGPDAIVCGPAVTLSATPSYGTGKWYENTTLLGTTPSLSVTIDPTKFVQGKVDHTFTWEETNWQCKNTDDVKISFDEPVSKINAGPDTTLFSFDNIIYMVAQKEQTWEKAEWTLVSGTGNIENANNNLTKISNLSKGVNSFLWKITNGTCTSEDPVSISVYELVIPEGFSPNDDPGGFNNTFVISGLDKDRQIAELTIVNGAGAEVFTTSNRGGQEWTAWDGKNSKGFDLPEGTYYYLLKLTSDPDRGGNGQVFKKSGFIILKRY